MECGAELDQLKVRLHLKWGPGFDAIGVVAQRCRQDDPQHAEQQNREDTHRSGRPS